nr:MAG TPA: hypothetical protein [Caudoviricetes sp.]
MQLSSIFTLKVVKNLCKNLKFYYNHSLSCSKT